MMFYNRQQLAFEYEYERIESVGRGGFNDDRAVKGMLRTFAAIRLYGLAAETTGFVPIHSDIFKKIAGARNYARYRDALKAGGCIDYKDAVIGKYEEKIQQFTINIFFYCISILT